ncbi:hypothetical protein RW092_02250 [Paenibacillus sp. 3LSP]|uniref:hypothetical protein n=1 Tax=Paenibacillus sp. 3LSP TaxID=2800795 RepID=UPI0028FD2FBB|nr:hypothetical protein [Paenibacillus sp. 3LSP]MDU0329023.1 hypothetical protein [Paenibacillus sp. 3LSP]
MTYYIKDAEYRRMDEHQGRPCAVIQVYPGAVGDPELFVYVARAADGKGYEIIRMIRSDADLEIDWYDNHLHQAFSEVAEEQFGDQGWPEPEVQRKEFLENLLAKDWIVAQLEQLPR